MARQTESASPDRKRPIRRAAILIIVVGGVAALIWHMTARQRLIAEIKAAGGLYEYIDPAPLVPRLLGRLWSSSVPQQERRVALVSPKFDDVWLTDHDHLAALPLTSLYLHRTSLTRQGVQELLRAHQLNQFVAWDVPLTEDEIPLLNQQVSLKSLYVSGTLITDAGLIQLDLPQLRSINLCDTQVTPEGLVAWLPRSSITNLTIDGRQFTSEVTQSLESLPQITSLELYGADVTDEHLERLSTLTTLRDVNVLQSSVTYKAAVALRDAHPE